jgi:flagellar P-ring protein precursor FlgI
MKLISLFFFCSLLLSIPLNAKVDQKTKIKDLVTIKGVRENPVIGYGLVIGLNGTGDGGGEITNKSLKKMFETLGLKSEKEISSKNVAAVIVTAKLPPFARIGQKLDVSIASIGDASSLAGGTLIVTPLKGGDGQIYAIASGAISIGGLNKGAKFATTGRVANGAIVEKEVDLQFFDKKALRMAIKKPDFTTAARVAKVINQELGGRYATAKDAATIDLIVPNQYYRKVVDLLAIIENFKVIPDRKAKIVINERTGTIVAGGNIKIKKVAISHGDLVVKTKDDNAGDAYLHLVDRTTTINELVNALNAVGAGPEDLISIFQTLHQNGALIADLQFI